MSEGILTTIEQLIEPVLATRNVTLFDMEYVKEGQDYFLRIYIDKAGGVDLTECGIVSELISEQLDAKDPIEDAYYLEVSSPGAERPLKTKQDLMDHVNENVFIALYVHIDNNKEYEGILKDFTDDIATIEYKDRARTKLVEIPYDKIAKARLSVML